MSEQPAIDPAIECGECGDPWEWHRTGTCTGDACDCERRIPDGWAPEEPEPEVSQSESPEDPEDDGDEGDQPEWAHGLEVVDLDLPDELAPQNDPAEAPESHSERLDAPEDQTVAAGPAGPLQVRSARCFAINRETLQRCALPPHVGGLHVPRSRGWTDEESLDTETLLQMAMGGHTPGQTRSSEVQVTRTKSHVPDELARPSKPRYIPVPGELVANPGQGEANPVDREAAQGQVEQVAGVCMTCKHPESSHGSMDAEEPGCQSPGCSCFSMI